MIRKFCDYCDAVIDGYCIEVDIKCSGNRQYLLICEDCKHRINIKEPKITFLKGMGMVEKGLTQK